MRNSGIPADCFVGDDGTAASCTPASSIGTCSFVSPSSPFHFFFNRPSTTHSSAVFIEEMERLARAQTARGVPFDEGGAITRAHRLGRLLIPIFISGFARADTLTIAMNTRSYRGGRHRTKLRQMRARASDWLVLAMVLALVRRSVDRIAGQHQNLSPPPRNADLALDRLPPAAQLAVRVSGMETFHGAYGGDAFQCQGVCGDVGRYAVAAGDGE